MSSRTSTHPVSSGFHEQILDAIGNSDYFVFSDPGAKEEAAQGCMVVLLDDSDKDGEPSFFVVDDMLVGPQPVD